MNALGDWYVKTKSGASGPHSIDALRRSASAGKLPKTAMLSQSPSGPWIAAGTIKVLFPEKEFTAEDLRPSDLVPDAIKDFSASAYDAIRKATTISTQVARDKLDSMAEAREQAARERQERRQREHEARQSKQTEMQRNREEYFSQPDPTIQIDNLHVHVHKYGDGSGGMQVPEVHFPRNERRPDPNPPQPTYVVVNNVSNHKQWSRGVAMVLSFLIPGLGQLYKGQVFNGLLWFVITFAGYICFIVPGLVLHICCILGAGTGNQYK